MIVGEYVPEAAAHQVGRLEGTARRPIQGRECFPDLGIGESGGKEAIENRGVRLRVVHFGS